MAYGPALLNNQPGCGFVPTVDGSPLRCSTHPWWARGWILLASDIHRTASDEDFGGLDVLVGDFCCFHAPGGPFKLLVSCH